MKNMGNIDRILRIAIAVIIAVLYLTGNITGTLAIIGLILSGIFILTSIVGICPLYLPFKAKTFKKKD